MAFWRGATLMRLGDILNIYIYIYIFIYIHITSSFRFVGTV